MLLKSKTLIGMALAVSTAAKAADLAVVATEGERIGTGYLFDGNASIGGGDYDSFNGPPESAALDRTWALALPGAGGVDVSVSGLAFGIPPAGNTNGNVITATVIYLGADGVSGGTDDVVLGNSKATLVLGTAASRYEWLFDSPITGNIDGIGSNFRVRLESLEADNGGVTRNMRFKTSSGAVVTAVKVDVAGTSTSNGLSDADNDGLHDAFETNTGIYAGPTNTGTNPAVADTDGDGLLDGVENNSRVWLSASKTGTSPFDTDTDNDGLTDNVETNTGVFVSSANTGTNPNNRDRDNDRISDGQEISLGLNPILSEDFDGDGFNDGLELVIYGTNPKLNTSFPGDGTHPAPLSFTPIEDAGVVNNIDLDIPSTLGSTIINEAGTGGSVDADFASGVTSFIMHFPNAFPAAGSAVSITGFAWPVISAINASGDILLQFYDPGADGVVDGVDTDTLVGTARGTLTVTGVTTIMYWNFTPIAFTSSGTGLVVKIQSSAALRIKAQDNLGSGRWLSNAGLASFGARSSRVSIGGTVTPPIGGFASWASANSTAGGIDDDHDGDGVANGIEYFLGGNSVTTGFTSLPGVVTDIGGTSITWTKAADYSGVYSTDFIVETSTSLTGTWTAATLGTGAGNVEITGNAVKFTFPAGTRQFARLRVTGP
ncbi:MAG: hypothetical protein MUF31_10235 [Akkermansiaceae bacterium]|jgi:hypothetical protein|nr:hypothetical protein [Akkermansiaceae bacterium]